MIRQITFYFFLLCLSVNALYAQKQTARDIGIQIGVLPVGNQNSITDVHGVAVGHKTLLEGENVRTGATAILPHRGNVFQHKVPAAVFSANGFGKLVGITQIDELGNLESPIVLTNTLSVPMAMNAIITHTLAQDGNEQVQSVNAVVGETNDGFLNDIRGRHVSEAHVLEAISAADTIRPQEGNVGAGTGTVCFGFKGGIGTSSRKLPESLGGYTIGVLVQSNFGGVLEINGAPVGRELEKFSFSNQLLNNVDGSCMIIVATDAPLDSRNLERVAKRAFMGLAKTGGIASNGSGDYVIAFSTAETSRVSHNTSQKLVTTETVPNDLLSPIFMAAIEAAEEAIINSLFAANTLEGQKGRVVEQIPWSRLLPILKTHRVIK